MEPTPVRDQVHDFTRACRALAGFAHAHNGLTDLERETVCTFIREMEKEVGLLSLQPSSPENAPLASTLSHLPPID